MSFDKFGLVSIDHSRESKYYSEENDFYYFKLAYSGDCTQIGYLNSYKECCVGEITVKMTISVASKWTTELLSQRIMIGTGGYDLAYQIVGKPATSVGTGPMLTDKYNTFWTRNSTIQVGKVKCSGGNANGKVMLGYSHPGGFSAPFKISWGIRVKNCGEVTASWVHADNTGSVLDMEGAEIKDVDPIVGTNRLIVW